MFYEPDFKSPRSLALASSLADFSPEPQTIDFQFVKILDKLLT